MKILDNNALNYIHKNKILIEENFFITTDIKDEFEAAFDEGMSLSIHDVTEQDFFDNALYIKNYKEMLNKYGGKLFYNMTGFGDISILALLKTQKESSNGKLPSMTEGCLLITTDEPLIKKVRKEFPDMADEFDKKLEIKGAKDYFNP